LPSDVIDGLSAAAKNQDGLGSPLSRKLVTNESTTPSVAEKLPLPLQVALVSKGFKASNIQARDFEDKITIEIAITNVLDKDIRAFDGVLTFTDLLDNAIFSSKIAINEPLKAGSVLSWKGEIKYNQFIDTHQRLRNEQQKNLKIRFTTRKILFADGTSKEY
jgi:tRNA(Phe) wybutosine-synthesizing methylase Tyw3